MSDNSSANSQSPVSAEVFAEIERYRAWAVKCGVFFWCAAVLTLFLGVVAFRFGGILTVLFFVTLVTAAGAAVVSCGARRNLRRGFKEKVVSAVVKGLYPGLDYYPERGIGEETLKESGLFKSRIDRYRCEDLVEGRIGETAFMLSEVNAERREVHRIGKTTTTTYVKVFRGVLIVADFHKDFRGRTVVVPDVAERLFGKLFGNFLQGLNFTERQLVKLEDPEFERFFAVYSDDQQQSRYILSPAMMGRLLALRKRLDRDIYAGFRFSRMYLAIMTDDDFFEPRYMRGMDHAETCRRIGGELTELVSIIDELALNTRIWSKTGSGRVNPDMEV